MTDAQHVTRRAVRHDLKLRKATVERVETITPRMRRITFGGPELAGFKSLAHDDHVKLFFPESDAQDPALPTVTADGNVLHPGDNHTPSRHFTPRRFDPERRELQIDFFLHGNGPASRWAYHARPGHILGIGGPKGSMIMTRHFEWYLLVGDETALPAIGRKLEQLPPHSRAIVIAEVANDTEKQSFASDADMTTIWLVRDKNRDNTLPPLLEALWNLEFPSGAGYAWIAAEAHTARDLRNHLLEARSFPKDCVRAAGYWQRDRADTHEKLDR